MFKFLKKIDDIGGEVHFIKDVLLSTGRQKKSIKAIDLDLFNLKWQAEYEGHYSKIFKTEAFTSNLNFYNVNGNITYSNPLEIHLSFMTKNDEGISVWNHIFDRKKRLSEYYLFNLDSKEFIKQKIPSLGAVVFIYKDLLILRSKDGKIIVYDYLKEEIVWEKSFVELCKYIDPFNDKERKGKIDHIYLYDGNKIILTTQYSYAFCFDIKTGEELWRNTYSSNYEINSDVAYVYSNGGSITKVDLKTGLVLNADGKPYHLSDLPPVGEIHISPYGKKLIYHNDSLWYLVHSNGYSFVVKINPDTFEYEWIHKVDTSNEIVDIKFYKERMYLRDIGNTLHIYDKV